MTTDAMETHTGEEEETSEAELEQRRRELQARRKVGGGDWEDEAVGVRPAPSYKGFGELVMLAPDDLIPTPDNPRVVVEDHKFAELVASVKTYGILEPVLARPHPDVEEKYDLRAGARRHRAATVAGLPEMPVIVTSMSDDEAMEVTVVENMHRSDLLPVEEASGIQKLMELGLSKEEIAERLGMGPAWVSRRASLTRLSERWRNEALNGDARALAARTLQVIARNPPHVQDELWDALNADWQVRRDGMGSVETSDIQRLLRRMQRDLRSAEWKLDDETLCSEAGACSLCPKRSSHAQDLFDPEELAEHARGSKAKGEPDICLDGGCWGAKLFAHVERAIAQAKAKYPGLVVAIPEYGETELIARFGKGALKIGYGAKVVKKGTPSSLAVFWLGETGVNGLRPLAVSHVQVKPAAGKQIAEDGTVTNKPKTLKEKRAELNQRRRILALELLREEIEAIASEPLKVKDWPQGLTPELAIVLGAAFGAEQDADLESIKWSDAERFKGTSVGDGIAVRCLWGGILANIRKTIFVYAPQALDRCWKQAETICEWLPCFSLERAMEAACEKRPEPKSWAAEAKGGKKSEKPAKANAAPRRRENEPPLPFEDLPDEDDDEGDED